MLNIYQHLSTALQLNLQDLFQLIIPNNCKNGHDNDVVLDAAEDVGDSWRDSYPWQRCWG